MARKRMLDPSIWADEDFNNLSSEAKILFIGIISNADDEGRLPGNSLYLTANIFPFAGMTKTTADKLRNEVLERMKSVALYEVDGKEYLQLKKWDDYQSINRPTSSKYPPLTDDSLRTHGRLTPNRIEENRIEEKRKEVKHLPSKDEVSLEQMEQISKQYSVGLSSIQNLWEELFAYCHSKGEKYSNFYMTLQVWTRRGIKREEIKLLKKEVDNVETIPAP